MMKNPNSLKPLVVTLIFICISFLLFLWLINILKGQEFRIGILVLVATGALGGLIGALLDNEGRFTMANYIGGKKGGLEFGSFTNVIAGIVTAFAVFFLMKGPLNLKIDNFAIENILGIIFVGVLSGIGGKRILPALARRFAEEALEKAKKLEEKENRKSMAVEKVVNAKRFMAQAPPNMESAEKELQEAIELDEENLRAYIELGRVRKRQAMAVSEGERNLLLRDAVRLCSHVIEKDPTYVIAYYNRSCYRCLLGDDIKDFLPDLKKSIELDTTNKLYARKEEDFRTVENEPLFKKLVEI